jgi:hypothetical protein
MYQIWKISAALLTTGKIINTDLEGPIARNTIMNLTQYMELGETCVNVHSQDHPIEI